MANETFPFMMSPEKMNEMFNPEKMNEMFKMPEFDKMFKKQVELTEQALASAKDKFAELQGQPMSPEHAQKALDEAKTAFDKAMTDMKELSEMAQKANTEAFDVIKSRFEEAMTEFKGAMDKAQASA